jgi:hypothetical protein
MEAKALSFTHRTMVCAGGTERKNDGSFPDWNGIMEDPRV